MNDAVWKRDEIESPCVRLCVVDPVTRLCLGCHRSIDEITIWSRMDPAARRAVMAELPARAEAAKPFRRGGRAARVGGPHD
jgi:predicted Fe-S protein YdhL (DUF1289 family)